MRTSRPINGTREKLFGAVKDYGLDNREVSVRNGIAAPQRLEQEPNDEMNDAHVVILVYHMEHNASITQ